MRTFQYKAKNELGETVEGALCAPSEAVAIKQLAARKIYPLTICEASSSQHIPNVVRSSGKTIPAKELYIFTSQLANLLQGGLPLLQSLDVLHMQASSARFQKVLSGIVVQLNDGVKFSESLEQHQNIFNDFYVSMVRAGEISGTLDVVLERLAEQLEKDYELHVKVTQALLYPGIILCVGILTVLVIMIFVIPKMSMMYAELDQTLPFMTRVLIQVSTFIMHFWWLCIGVGIGIVVCVRGIVNKSAQSVLCARIVGGVPLWGVLYSKEQVVRFSQTLALLLASGVSILDSLRIVERVVQGAIFKNAVETIRRDIEQGSHFSDAIGKTACFPPFLRHLVAVGEKTGALDQALQRIGLVTEKELNRTVKRFMTLLEPLLILVIGGVVAIIALGMFLPIFQINVLAQ